MTLTTESETIINRILDTAETECSKEQRTALFRYVRMNNLGSDPDLLTLNLTVKLAMLQMRKEMAVSIENAIATLNHVNDDRTEQHKEMEEKLDKTSADLIAVMSASTNQFAADLNKQKNISDRLGATTAWLKVRSGRGLEGILVIIALSVTLGSIGTLWLVNRENATQSFIKRENIELSRGYQWNLPS